MSSITLPFTYTDGQVLTAAELNACDTTIYNDYNGNITDFNIAGSAAITLTKLGLNPGSQAFNRMTTGNKTWSSGLTTDTQPGVTMTSDGWLEFGPGGTTAPDVYLYRSAANTLKLAVPGGGTPSLDFNSATLVNLPIIGVASGGTGLGTVAAGALLLGNTTSAMNVLAVAANHSVVVSNGSTYTTVLPLTTASGGTGITTTPTNGQIPIGNGTNYVAAAISNGVGTVVNNGAGTISIDNVAIAAIQGLRCSISSTLPVPADGSNTTLYAIPATSASKFIALYNGTKWLLDEWTTAPSVAVPATTNTLYDFYATDSSGAPAVGLNAWSGSTPPTRGTQDGIIWTGDNTKRLIAVVSTNGTSGTVPDTAAERYVWNVNNQVPRNCNAFISGGYTASSIGTALRAANSNVTNGQGRFAFVCGQPIAVTAQLNATVSANVGRWEAALAIDSVTVADASCPTTGLPGVVWSVPCGVSTHLSAQVATAGVHYCQMLEAGGTAGASVTTLQIGCYSSLMM